jgi:predicted AAA+ superfamily ATPase
LVDRPASRARFLLLGSAAPTLVRGVSETLAGRVHIVPVPGLGLGEVGALALERLWIRGGFPRSFLARDDLDSLTWREDFVQTFLERDIPALGLDIPASTLARFWTMLAHYHGQTWNAAELARSMSAQPRTVDRYRDVLAGTFMIRVLQPWFENLSKRQTKSPKVYLRDSGLLHALLRIDSLADLRSHPRYGASWEGFALEQLLQRFGERDAWFWGTQRGAELDLLLLRNGKRFGFELKCSDAPRTTRSMHIALDDLGLEHLYTVYPGTRTYPLTERITALPLIALAQLQLGTQV